MSTKHTPELPNIAIVRRETYNALLKERDRLREASRETTRKLSLLINDNVDRHNPNKEGLLSDCIQTVNAARAALNR